VEFRLHDAVRTQRQVVSQWQTAARGQDGTRTLLSGLTLTLVAGLG
jgi:hypothetical protein